MSFIRKATCSVIAGKSPADAAQPFGMNGIIVAVQMNVTHEPRAPRIPNFLFQNPKNKSVPNVHSETPRAIADIRNQYVSLVLKPFLNGSRGLL
jgi:hypothetical protein